MKKLILGLFSFLLCSISFSYGTNYSVYHNSNDGLITFMSGDQAVYTIKDHVVGQNCTYDQYLAGQCSYDDFLGCFFQVHNNYCFRYNGIVNKTYDVITTKGIGSNYGAFNQQYQDYYYFYSGGQFSNNGYCTLSEYNYNVPYLLSGNNSTFYKLNTKYINNALQVQCNGVEYSYGGTYGELVDYFDEYSPWFNSGSIYGVSPCGTGFELFDYPNFYYLFYGSNGVGTALGYFNNIFSDFGFFRHRYVNNNLSFAGTGSVLFWSKNLINKSSSSTYSGYISTQGYSSYYNSNLGYFTNYITLISAPANISTTSSNFNRVLPMLCQAETPISPNSSWKQILLICDGSDCSQGGSSSSTYNVNYNNGNTATFNSSDTLTINGYSILNGTTITPYFNISYVDEDNQTLTESYDKTNLILGGKFSKTYTGGENNFWVLTALGLSSMPDILYTGLDFTGSSNISGNVFTNFVDNGFNVIGTNIPNFISYGFVLIILIILIRLIRKFKGAGKGRI